MSGAAPGGLMGWLDRLAWGAHPVPGRPGGTPALRYRIALG